MLDSFQKKATNVKGVRIQNNYYLDLAVLNQLLTFVQGIVEVDTNLHTLGVNHNQAASDINQTKTVLETAIAAPSVTTLYDFYFAGANFD